MNQKVWWIDYDAPPNGIGPICKFCHRLIDMKDDHDVDCTVVSDFLEGFRQRGQDFANERGQTVLRVIEEDPTLDGPPQLSFPENSDAAIEAFALHIESATATRDVCAVILRVWHDGKTWLIEGSARRAPGDKPDYDVAWQVAMGRALQSVTRQFMRQAEGGIKNNAWIRKEHRKALKKQKAAKK